ncbi:mCG147764 [Mus musculus]|nr:mCG147764 [Mus musculus]
MELKGPLLQICLPPELKCFSPKGLTLPHFSSDSIFAGHVESAASRDPTSRSVGW